MASIRKRTVNGKVRWDVTVTRIGAPRQTRTFQMRTAAESWAREMERDVERGAWRSIDMAERITVGDLLLRFSEEVLPMKKAVKEAQGLALRLTRHEEIARLPLIALTPEAIARFRDKRLRTRAVTGGGRTVELKRYVSPQTVRHELAMLKRAITHALREWGLYLPAGNPVAFVKLPSPGRGRTRRPSSAEYRHLLADAYRCRAPYLGHAIEFAVETAMRRGEICNLTWVDIDFDRRVATAHETKNGDTREVPLSTRALEVLRSMPRPIHGGRVFQLSKDGFTQAFTRLCRRQGIQNLHLHDLRHEGTTRLSEKLNGDLMALSAITGHKTLQMLKRYTHLRAEDLARRIA